MPLPPVVLLGPGRCGSTLLQRILNTSDKLAIWGEHSGFLRGFASAWGSLMDKGPIHRRHWDRPSANHLVLNPLTDYATPINWANPFSKEGVEDTLREAVLRMLASEVDTENVHWGFKEIRYSKSEPFMPMWQKLFPGTIFVFVVRNPMSVMQSMLIDWWVKKDQNISPDAIDEKAVAPYVDRAANLYARRVGAINEWHADPSIRSHVVHFEELETDHETCIRAIFEHLDLPLPANAFEPMGRKTSVSRNSPMAPRVREAIEAAKPRIGKIIDPVAGAAGY